jgi:hypothetical protein
MGGLSERSFPVEAGRNRVRASQVSEALIGAGWKAPICRYPLEIWLKHEQYDFQRSAL